MQDGQLETLTYLQKSYNQHLDGIRAMGVMGYWNRFSIGFCVWKDATKKEEGKWKQARPALHKLLFTILASLARISSWFMAVIRSRTAHLAGVEKRNSLFKLLPSLQFVHDCVLLWVVFQGGSVMDGQFTLEEPWRSLNP